jgi:endoglucanase
MKKYFYFLLIILLACNSHAQKISTDVIRLNQIGYYPHGPKIALVISDKICDYELVDIRNDKAVFKGKSAEPVVSPLSGKFYSTADFTTFNTPGVYVLNIMGVGKSHPFEIRKDIHRDLAKASIKKYYFQRLSIPLEEKYAGKWKRNAGHPDDVVLIHESAASVSRPVGFKISSSKGWYDAGDYNKYIVNSGITMGTMLSAYEDFPAFYNQLELGIPETGNEIPDLLDEILWNLRWMLTMQDPADGGVYHKLTNAQFDPMVMPDKAVTTRYVVQKSTAATLDFAAVTAQSARVLRNFEKQLPGLADSCLRASRLAYAWAMKNPAMLYEQDKMNKKFEPDVVTGAYGDGNVTDEFSWAAAELYVTTSENSFLSELKKNYDAAAISVPDWTNVRLCGYYSLMRFKKSLPEEGRAFADDITSAFLKYADRLMLNRNGNPLNCVMGKVARDFVWGSSAVAANQAIVFLNAYSITGKPVYLENALHNLDYLLGRNGTGYSFVTGYGDKTPMHPHHRPSEADGIPEPVPGMLSGGPNPGRQDKCRYGSTFPDEAFIDDVCSYASNEIAINWNAPLVYLTGAVEAWQRHAGYSPDVKE